MSVPDLPEWVNGILDTYSSDSGYERRYSEAFREMNAEKQLLVVLVDLYPEKVDPIDLNEYMDCSVGEMYPHLRNLEQDEIVTRSNDGQYQLAWRRPTENRLESYFS